jgi:hypothetical protein
MGRFPALAATLWLLIPAAPSFALDDLRLHTAEYRVRISVLSGKLNTRLGASESGYAATHRIVPTGLASLLANGHIEESSRFSASADGVLPVHYVSADTLSKDNTSADVAFDWTTGAVAGTINDEFVVDQLDGVAHDRVSIQYELMNDLRNGALRDSYRLFDIDKIKVLQVTSVGSREVEVPAGKFTAIGIQHQAENSSRVTTLWCVEELDYLPVIIEQHRDGKLNMRATLDRYTPEPGES